MFRSFTDRKDRLLRFISLNVLDAIHHVLYLQDFRVRRNISIHRERHLHVVGLFLCARAVANRWPCNDIFKLLVADLKMERLAFVSFVFFVLRVTLFIVGLLDQNCSGFLLEEIHLGFAEVKNFGFLALILAVRDCLLYARNIVLGLFLRTVIFLLNVLVVGIHAILLVQDVCTRDKEVASVFWHLSKLFICAFKTHLLVVGRGEDILSLGLLRQLSGEDLALNVGVGADV